MKSDLSDVTFIIPLKVDTINRIENLQMVTEFILENFKCQIKVLEVGEYDNGIVHKIIDEKIEYTFIEDRDPIFYRTKYLNLLTNCVLTQFVGVWDADVLMEPTQIIDSIEQLRKGEADIAYPYDGRFLDTSMIIRELYYRLRNMKVLKNHIDKMKSLYVDRSVGAALGGAFLINTELYKKSGLENESFYGWGPEDSERYQRWKSLNYAIYRASGCLFHLSHNRGVNSSYHNNRQAERKINQVKKNKYSSAEEILREL